MFFIILLIILLILLLYLYYSNVTSNKEGWRRVGRSISRGFRRVTRDAGRAIDRTARDTGRSIVRTARDAGRAVEKVANDGSKWVSDQAKDAYNKVQDEVVDSYNKVAEEAQKIANDIKNTAIDIGNRTADYANKAKDLAQKVIDEAIKIIDLLTGAYQALVALYKKVVEFVNKIGSTLKMGGVMELLNNFGNQIENALQQFNQILVQLEFWNKIPDQINVSWEKVFNQLSRIDGEFQKIEKKLEVLPQEILKLGDSLEDIGDQTVAGIKRIPVPFIEFGKIMTQQFEEIATFMEDIWGGILDLPWKFAKEVGIV